MDGRRQPGRVLAAPGRGRGPAAVGAMDVRAAGDRAVSWRCSPGLLGLARLWRSSPPPPGALPAPASAAAKCLSSSFPENWGLRQNVHGARGVAAGRLWPRGLAPGLGGLRCQEAREDRAGAPCTVRCPQGRPRHVVPAQVCCLGAWPCCGLAPVAGRCGEGSSWPVPCLACPQCGLLGDMAVAGQGCHRGVPSLQPHLELAPRTIRTVGGAAGGGHVGALRGGGPRA